MKKLLFGLLKIAISVAIIGYLVVDAESNREFTNLWNRPKEWWYFLAAVGALAGALLLTLIRWCYLARALDIPFPLRDAMRLGLLGYLFNLAPLGVAGGDLLRAVLLARKQPGRRVKAVASVIVDRLIGLYVLFLVAAAAILATGAVHAPAPPFRLVSNITLALALAGTIVVARLSPALTEGKLIRSLEKLPRVGRHMESLVDSVRMYRRKPQSLLRAALESVGVHVLTVLGVYFIACGLSGDVPSLAAHFVIVPVSAATSVIPLSIGPFEFVLSRLYASVSIPAGAGTTSGQGLIVALAYRIVSVLLAAMGACYYFGSRHEVADVIHAIEEEDLEDLPDPLVVPRSATPEGHPVGGA